MQMLASSDHRVGINAGGRVTWLSGADGVNRIKGLAQPMLRLVCLAAGGERVELKPNGPPDVQRGPDRLVVTWTRFAAPDGMLVAVRAEAAVVVAKTEAGSFEWHLRLQSGAVPVVEALYPIVGGLVGEQLFMPHHAGERIADPARTLISDRYQAFHRAQSVREPDGTYSRELPYCGLASMAWMELDGPSGGTYLGSHDPDFKLTGLRVETDGDSLTLAIRRCCTLHDGVWTSPPAVLLPHEGDWHTGARVYRSWIGPRLPSPQRPACLAGRPALNPRYDFKNGGAIRHRFAEIPAMHDAGVASGIDHFFLAGWNRGGFDTLYPDYRPDPELGTATELAEGCRYIRERGDVATFYINARIFDLNSPDYPTLGVAWAIKDAAGRLHHETYEPNQFAVMCPGHAPWRQHLADAARRLIRTTGCQGIYLDQLGSATPYACYDQSHTHGAPDEFNRGYVTLLEQLRDEAALMIENCGDIYSSRIWGSLAWNGELYDEFFNLYRFTFPEHNLINMVHPRHMADPAERERCFYRDLDRAWLLGSYYWAAPQRRFKPGDDKMLAYLTEALRIRRAAEPYFAAARFADTQGVQVESTGSPAATRFDGDGFALIAVANPTGANGRLILPEPPAQVTCLAFGQAGEACWRTSGDSSLPLPKAPLALLILR